LRTAKVGGVRKCAGDVIAPCEWRVYHGGLLNWSWWRRWCAAKDAPEKEKKAMKAAIAILVAFAAFAQDFTPVRPAADTNGWGKVRWGMTVAEAKAALGDDAVVSTVVPGPNFTLIDRLTIKNVKIGDITASASIQTGRNSEVVCAVTINAAEMRDLASSRARTFDSLKRLLIEKYGAPKSEDRKPTGRGVEMAAIWTLPSTSITLRWYEIPGSDLGFVTIEYRAVDKKALDVL
jgi:hypothetical protein